MTFRKIFFLLFAGSIWLLTSQCAQIVTPNGGPKDTKPPRAIKYYPDSAKTNFNAKSIEILFNEYIQLNDLQKQLVISPPMNVQPEIRVKGKSLYIELKDSLKRNTTYALNFGDAIRDITENNSAANFQYIFSTGNYIDSLTLSGTVKNAFDLKADKGILVMLYDRHDDSVPRKWLPSYFAKTKADGSYKINNIRPGTYKVFALKDANSNYLYDLPAEQIAFSDTLVNIKKKTEINLFLFKDEPPKQKLLKAAFAEHGHIVFALAKPADNTFKLNFISKKPEKNIVYEYSQNKDTLHFWFADDLSDTIKIQMVQNEKTVDTLRIKPITLEQMKKSMRGGKWALSSTSNINKEGQFDFNNAIKLKFNHPVIKVTSDKIELKQAGKKIDFSNSYVSDSIKREFDFVFPLLQDSSYQLLIAPGAFTDIFGLSNDTIKANFRTREEKYYGTMKLSLKMKIRIKYILQLMNEKGEVFQPVSSDKGIFSYQYLPPGSYRLRIIYDKNGDDKWTPGSYSEKRKPETVIYYPGPVTIRSNWDLDLDWKVE